MLAKLILICLFGIITTNTLAQSEEFTIAELTGQVSPKDSQNPYKLRGEVYLALKNLQQAALKDGIQIKVVSAFRSYQHQQQIWNRKYKKFRAQGLTNEQAVKKIIEYSTIPGTSRHHWGTDIDLVPQKKHMPNNLLLPKNFEENEPFYDFKIWMEKNAEQFGFQLVYTNDPNRKGFYYEPWHYTYHSTASKMLKSYADNQCFFNLKLANNLGLSSTPYELLEDYYYNHIINP